MRADVLELIKTRFFVQNAFGFVENGTGFLGRIADRRQAQASDAAKRAEHVKNDARLSDLSEMQTAPNDKIENVVGRESSIARRFEMIARHQKLPATIRC